MTRAEAIAIIEQALPTADEETLAAAAKLFKDTDYVPELGRALTGDELASIEAAKADFKAGRTLTSAEAQAYIDTELAKRRAQRAAKV